MSEVTVGKKGRIIIPDEFERIKVHELQTGDIVLFIGGNKLTEWHGRNRRVKLGRSNNPPYHAAIVYKYDIILDPVGVTELQHISKYMKQPDKRLDIIRYKLTEHQKELIRLSIEDIISKIRVYDWKGYGAFISQMPGMKWFKFVKPSDKTFYCSDAVTYCHEEGFMQAAGEQNEVSPRTHNFTAPVDLQLYALENLEKCEIKTLKNKGE